MNDSGRSRSAVLAWSAVLVLLIGVVALVTYALTHVSTPATVTQTARTSPAVLATLATVPMTTFDEVGVTVPGVDLTPPEVVTGQAPLVSGGLPEVLAIGAEYCPFCAAERWPLVVALARFGHFTVLHDATSAAQSVFPGTPTFSFAHVGYSSRFVAFTGVELFSGQTGADGTFIRITRLTPDQSALVARFGAAGEAGGITEPFVDVAGRMVATTAAFSPALLAGQSQAQIADEASQPPAAATTGSTTAPPTGQAIIAAANQLTAGICVATGQRPASVCQSRGVRSAAESLGLVAPAPAA